MKKLVCCLALAALTAPALALNTVTSATVLLDAKGNIVEIDYEVSGERAPKGECLAADIYADRSLKRRYGTVKWTTTTLVKEGEHRMTNIKSADILVRARKEYPNAVVALYIAASSGGEASDLVVAEVKSSAASGSATAAYAKARTVTGLYRLGEDVVGTATVKFGKVSKNGQVKVSATLVPFSGRKLSASATVTPDADGAIDEATLVFKAPVGAMTLSAGADEDGEFAFEASNDDYALESATVGGALANGTASFAVNVDEEPDFGDDFEAVTDFPDGVEGTVKGGKIDFGKAAKVKYRKYREDGETSYALEGTDDGEKPNVSALTLKYKVKTGVFTGSFKVYASNESAVDDGKSPKLKAYKATVRGILVGGTGHGTATLKVGKTTYAYPATLEASAE